MRDHRGFVGEGFVNAAGWAGVDEDLGDFDEGIGIDAEGKHLARATWTLVAEAEVEHREVDSVLNNEWV